MKIRAVGAELFHADGQRDKTKLSVALCRVQLLVAVKKVMSSQF
jgi:hypothetical protein